MEPVQHDNTGQHYIEAVHRYIETVWDTQQVRHSAKLK